MFLFSIGLMLAAARIFGEIAQWLRQPAIVGELLAGIFLGPSVLGALSPSLSHSLFPQVGDVATVRETFMTFSITLFLLVAGLEVDLSSIWKQGVTALKVGTAGMVFPLSLGFLSAWWFPELIGKETATDPFIFSLFFGTALSISALPVIAKMLMDLNLFRSDMGMVIISAAILNDLAGWVIFAITLGMMDQVHTQTMPIWGTIACILLFSAGMLTVGRWMIDRILPYLQAYGHGPGAVFSFALVLALVGGAFTEWIGVHTIFGAFLVGVAIGDSSHLRERTRTTIDSFVSFIFAPLFFSSIGLKVDFVTHFDIVTVVVVLLIACAGKLIGCWIGAAWAGLPTRERWGIGFGMNARGAMEIILGMLALEAGVIGESLFVALVIMAIVTSILGGPMLQLILGQSRRATLANMLSKHRYIHRLKGRTRREVIEELAHVACSVNKVDANEAISAVLDREAANSSGIGKGISIPHAQISGLAAPILAVGISEAGVDFGAPDQTLAHMIFLVLTPDERSNYNQLQLNAIIAEAFQNEKILGRILQARNFTGALAVLKS
ncbi:cation:proton antiporter [Planctomicrobium sp. SH668]|uniref:cation:proton antiporter domain-containing protein n=1 Tax=Planctomicrobium sp. SH668 TaxID=3448126 RepID=UPI003F5B8219